MLRACERNDFKEAQRRVALAKFLGECFNFRVVHTSTLFEALYRLINERCHEHMKATDSPQDSFRIRLVCTTLDSLGKGHFQRGPRRKMMDRFLMYFQRYIYSKSYVLMDLEFMVLDTFDSLRPALIKFQTPEEAEKACEFIAQREAAGLDIQDVLGSYQKDGGGYELSYYCLLYTSPSPRD